MNILLDFADGSMGTVHYLANGSKQFPKERVEVFSQGRVLVLDNFRKLQGYGWSGVPRQWPGGGRTKGTRRRSALLSSG